MSTGASAKTAPTTTSFQYNPSDRGGIENEDVDLFLMNSSNGNLSGYWNTAYSGIARANFALENLEGLDFADKETPPG